jgi:5,10-methylenetetrahydrofolate reductase
MTQVLFDLAYLDAFLERLGGDSPIPLLVGVWALPSLQLAQRIHNEVPGIVVPEHVQSALRDAGSDAARVGTEVAQNVIEGARTRARGVYVVAPFRSPERALELFR